jgi:hypothetical protein
LAVGVAGVAAVALVVLSVPLHLPFWTTGGCDPCPPDGSVCPLLCRAPALGPLGIGTLVGGLFAAVSGFVAAVLIRPPRLALPPWP